MYAGKKKGWGLFASEDIECGTFIVEYMGEVVDQKRYLKRKKEYEGEKHTYFMLLNASPQEMIDASRYAFTSPVRRRDWFSPVFFSVSLVCVRQPAGAGMGVILYSTAGSSRMMGRHRNTLLDQYAFWLCCY
jgi:hypothetical protein